MDRPFAPVRWGISNAAPDAPNKHYNPADLPACRKGGEDGVMLEIRPNGFSNLRGLYICAVILSAITTLTGIMFAFFGAWPVLPFAGLEAALLLVSAGFVAARARATETLVFSKDYLHVSKGYGKRRAAYSFPKPWARVALRPGQSRHDPPALTLGSHGRTVEIGGSLVDRRKARLYRQIAEILDTR